MDWANFKGIEGAQEKTLFMGGIVNDKEKKPGSNLEDSSGQSDLSFEKFLHLNPSLAQQL